MLHKETVSLSTLNLLNKLMGDECLSAFTLVGGTSLALQIGHRVSVDLDLFSTHPFDESDLAEYLSSTYGMELDFLTRSTVKGEIAGVQIDCLSHSYPLVNSINVYEGIRLASLEDIAAMKLNAISGNGTRIKDYIDIAYLSGYLSLNSMLEAYQQKYKTTSVIIPLKAITYFDEINFREPIKMTGDKRFNWKEMEMRLKTMQNNPKVDQPEKLGGNRKSATFAAMETGYELLLPEGVLKYFEVVFAEKTSSTITIHLDELNIIPEEYKEDKLESKGFYPSVAIQDYPLRGKVVILQVRRRRWTNHSTGDIVCRNWDMVAKGTRLTQEFASFLKELHRYSSC